MRMLTENTPQRRKTPRQDRKQLSTLFSSFFSSQVDYKGKGDVGSQSKVTFSGKTIRKGRESSSKRINSSRKDPQNFSMFQSSTHYILDDVNSIAYANQRFYNLLKVRPRNLWGRQVRCKCSRSRCQARYCQCFSHGQVCGLQCSCVNCGNKDQDKHINSNLEVFKEDSGCKCSKSGCLKNYCECYQRGLNCTDKCRCSNCGNSL